MNYFIPYKNVLKCTQYISIFFSSTLYNIKLSFYFGVHLDPTHTDECNEFTII